MIEGQNGLTWARWQRLAQAVEELGFAGLYRSDHYTNANPPDKESLEVWVSLTWLASHSRRIQFGPLVCPFSFRDPTMLARTASAVDDLSGGRLALGLGAGWQEREHNNYGWDLLDIKDRFERFEEGLEVVSRLLNSAAPVDFQGKYYRLKDAILLPRPHRPGGPPITIGGNGEKRTLRFAARFAQEWNAVFIPAHEFARLNRVLDSYLAAINRPASSLRRSIMTGCIFAANDQQLEQKVSARTGGRRKADELRQHGLVVGTAEQMRSQLAEYAAAGAQRIMLQWLDLDDLHGLAGLADAALPDYPT